jgi:hypothetical protein
MAVTHGSGEAVQPSGALGFPVRPVVIALALASLVANGALLVRRWTNTPAAAPAPAPVETPPPAEPAPAPQPPAVTPPADPQEVACQARLGNVERALARTRSALDAVHPEAAFRRAHRNEAVTREVETALTPMLADTIAGTERHRLECRGALCRLELTGLGQYGFGALALHRRAVLAEKVPRLEKIYAGGVEATVDPATGKRRFVTTMWIDLAGKGGTP